MPDCLTALRGRTAFGATLARLPPGETGVSQALQEVLLAALHTARVCVWTQSTLQRLNETAPLPGAFDAQLDARHLTEGLTCDSELWWADDECFPAAAGLAHLLHFPALLLVRFRAGTPRPAALDGIGSGDSLVMVVVALSERHPHPALITWWEPPATLGQLTEEIASHLPRQPGLAVSGCALAYWTAIGLAARTSGSVVTVAAETEAGPVWVCCDPRELTAPKGAVVQ